MHYKDRTNAEIEALINGEPTLGTSVALSEFISQLRAEYKTTESVPVGTALGEFLDVADLIPTACALSGPSRRKKMLAGIGAFVATTTGKIVLGTAVAAASVGTAQATQLVDIPGLPDNADTPVVVIFEEPATAGQPDDVPADAGERGRSIAEDATSGTPGKPADAGERGRSIADDAGKPADAGERGRSIAEDAGKPADAGERGRSLADDADDAGDAGQPDSPVVPGDAGQPDSPVVPGDAGQPDSPVVPGDAGQPDLEGRP